MDQKSKKSTAVVAVLFLCVILWAKGSGCLGNQRYVWLVNGTNEAYTLTFPDGGSLVLEPGTPVEAALGQRQHRFTILRSSGAQKDVVSDNSLSVLLAPFTMSETEVLNPDGCAVFAVDEREYTISTPDPEKRVIWYGATSYRLMADYAFRDFPWLVSTHGGRTTKRRLTVSPTLDDGLLEVEEEEGIEMRRVHANRCADFLGALDADRSPEPTESGP